MTTDRNFCRVGSTWCYGLGVCVPPISNSYVETLNPNIMVFGAGGLGRECGNKGGSVMMELVPYKKRHERTCFLSLLSTI